MKYVVDVGVAKTIDFIVGGSENIKKELWWYEIEGGGGYVNCFDWEYVRVPCIGSKG